MFSKVNVCQLLDVKNLPLEDWNCGSVEVMYNKFINIDVMKMIEVLFLLDTGKIKY